MMRFYRFINLSVTLTALLLASAIPPGFAQDTSPEDWHKVKRCAVIANLDEFPHTALIARVHLGGATRGQYLVREYKCLYKGHRFNRLTLYAVPKSLLKDKKIKDLELTRLPEAIPGDLEIKTWGNHVPPENRLKSMGEIYMIAGFASGKMVLYKVAETRTYLDGRPVEKKFWSQPNIEGLRLRPDLARK